jgi:hypothetical protein
MDPVFVNPFTRYIYMDSDILFFGYPKELVDWVTNPGDTCLYSAHLPYSLDILGSYWDWMVHSHRLLLFWKYKSTIDPTFNSGLLCISDKRLLDLKKINSIADFLYKNFYAYQYLAEETLASFYIKPAQYKKLPVRRYMNIWHYRQWLKKDEVRPVSVHYLGYTKPMYKSDGIRMMVKTRFFSSGAPAA